MRSNKSDRSEMRGRVSASEFVFLAIGLLLGGIFGAAIVRSVRGRRMDADEVQVALAPDAIPRRRSSTLADDAFPSLATATPTHGGPADQSVIEVVLPAVATERQTPDLSESTDPIDPIDPFDPTDVAAVPPLEAVRRPVFRLSAPPDRAGDIDAELVSARQAVPVSGGADPVMTALRASESAAATVHIRTAVQGPTSNTPAARAMVLASAGGTPAQPGLPARPDATAASPDATVAPAAPDAPPEATLAPAAPDAPPDATLAPAAPDAPHEAIDAATSPCAEARRLADERCALATRAREGAVAVEAALHAAQRAHEEHEAGAAAAAGAADARAVRDAKDDAQARFVAGRTGATKTEEVEAAARIWLLEINAINLGARDAHAALTREREAANAIATRLDRLSLEADAARIAAGTAEAACLAAREALAACEEREAVGPRGHLPVLPETDPEADVPVGIGSGGTAALGGAGSPRIFRLLRGDRTAMAEMVAALGGDDPGDRRRWQLAIADLVDAIVADSIEASALEFPAGHHFWGPFTPEQSREIAGALSSLGYRFDGLGGWVDLRVPSQRDLSLAIGYAGIDPMRLRNWPTVTQMTELYRDVEVAAAEHVSAAAGDLTLGELVSMLGRRADGLAEVWNHWGTIRPLLLEDA